MSSFATFNGNPDDLLRDWLWLLGNETFKLLAISPFGDLLFRDTVGDVFLLDVNIGRLEYPTIAGNDPATLFPENFDDRIARGYREAGLILKPETCYGYKIQCVTGGTLEVENVYIATLSDYVSFMGAFHYQIRDVADGEKVIIKVVRSKPN